MQQLLVNLPIDYARQGQLTALEVLICQGTLFIAFLDPNESLCLLEDLVKLNEAICSHLDRHIIKVMQRTLRLKQAGCDPEIVRLHSLDILVVVLLKLLIDFSQYLHILIHSELSELLQ